MVPAAASLHICPVSMKAFWQEKVAFWKDVYGFDYDPFKSLVLQRIHSQPTIATVAPEQCLAPPEQVLQLDLKYVDAEDVKTISGRFQFEMQKNAILHGFVCWFDVEFEGALDVTLSTGPETPETHWQQTVMFLPDALMVNKSDTLACSMSLMQDEANPRRYDICIEVDEAADDEEGEDDERTSDTDIVMETKDLIQKTLGSQS